MRYGKRGRWMAWVGLGACGLALILAFGPLSRPALDDAIVVLRPAGQRAAPGGEGDVLTILYSGDGGWADLDKEVASALVASGMPVIGVNTFKYFWRQRSPEAAGADLDALITDYLAAWHKRRIWLIGFSFGADVLPNLIDRLSPENRARITQLVLLSPSREATFEITLQGYMANQGRFRTFIKTTLEKLHRALELPALPALDALQGRFPVACYYGLGDADESLCTAPGLPPWVAVHARHGGHHFDEDYHRLAAEMLAELPHAGAAR